MPKPNLLIISLGGTIAMTKRPGDAGVTPALDGADLIKAVPEFGAAFAIESLAFRQVASANITLDDLVALSGIVARALDGGKDGVVITQGTDTLAETAFTLDLLLNEQKPVVVTGAMRHPAQPGADGPANLLAAARVAGSRAAHGLGVLAVMNDSIHAAQFVTKAHSGNVAAFASPAAGPVGWVVEGGVRILTRPALRKHLTLKPGQTQQPVALMAMGSPDDIALLAGIRQAGYRGLVIEALGGGHVPEAAVEPLGDLARDMPVVFASRTGNGEILRATYGYQGGEIDLISRGLIPAGFLDGAKARILLSLLLRQNAGRDEIADIFDWRAPA